MRKRAIYTIIIFIVLAFLDNAAISLLNPITESVAADLLIPASTYIMYIVSITSLIIAITSFIWGYYGDKYPRKKLLLYGTIIWSIACLISGFSVNYLMLFIFQGIAGIGLGCIASVGFSIIIDFISPKKRGFALSIWGLSQSVGTFLGFGLSLIFEPIYGWGFSFILLAFVTFGFIVAYFFTEEPKRGATEEELENLFDKGELYEYRIKRSDLKYILKKRTNIWLILQGFFAQFGWGAIAFLPAVIANKISIYGLTPDIGGETYGGIIAALFQLGGIFSIIFGWLGDKLQKKTLKGRSYISSIGMFSGIILFILILIIPYNFSSPPDTSNFGTVFIYLLSQLATNPLFLVAFICSVIAAAAYSADSPNFFALVGDINLPEHRGTLFGITNFTNGIGRFLGQFILPTAVTLLTPILVYPNNWIYAMIFIQLFFIATGIFYTLTIYSVPKDIKNVKNILKDRADKAITE